MLSADVRRLCLLRHAEAQNPVGLPDHERPLTEAGQAAAVQVGVYMQQQGITPGQALVSTARRTRATWEATQERLAGFVPANFEKQLYESTPDNILECVQYAPDEQRCLLVVGHNPGLHQLALQLANQGEAAAMARLQQQFPPGALAVIDFDSLQSWQQISNAQAYLYRYFIPDVAPLNR